MMTETETPPVDESAADSAAAAKADDIHPAARPFLFLGKESVKRNFIWLPLIGMIVCIIIGVFYPQAKALPIEKYIPGSWAIYGFLAYSAIVLSANTLFNFLGRDEAYYGEGGLPDPEYSTDPAITGEPHHD